MKIHFKPAKVTGLMLAALMFIAAPAIAGLSRSGAASIDPELSKRMASSGGSEIALYVHGMNLDAALGASRQSGLTVVDTFPRISVAYAYGEASEIQAAAQAPGVTYLEADREIDFHMQTSHLATRGADAIDGFTVDGITSAPLDGRGVSIAIVDSGIDGSHPMFQQGGSSKVVRNMKLACHQVLVACTGPNGDANDPVWVDVTGKGNDSDSPSAGGHGTHVASTAAGVAVQTADGRSLRGAAPGAKLVGISIGQAISIYGGNSGLNWALEHHAAPCGPGVPTSICPPIKVLNNSWGVVGGGEFDPNSTTSKLSDLLVDAGITISWSAGNGDALNNGGTGADNRVNPYAQNPKPGVIGVANYDDFNAANRDGALNSSSSRGRRGVPATYPDISAPGTDITAACRAYLAVCNSRDKDLDYGTISGTSMAAPHIAGIAALLLEADPTLTPAKIEKLLEDTAHKFTFGGGYEADPRNPDDTTSYDKGHGLVDVASAVATVRNMNAPFTAPLCTVDGAVLIDKGGDAKDVSLVTGQLESEPSLDILESRLEWVPDADVSKSAVVFKIKVTDLQTQPPIQNGFVYTFSYGSGRYFVDAQRDSFKEKFSLGTYTSTIRKGLVSLTGTFDVANDEIRIVLPNAKLTEANPRLVAEGLPTADPFVDGSVLTGFSMFSGRQVEARLPDQVPPYPPEVPAQARTRGLTSTLQADSADGRCPYTLGLGAVAPPGGVPEPPPPPPPAPNGTVDGDNPSYTWTGAAKTDMWATQLNGGCNGSASNSACDIRRVQINPPAGVTSTVTFAVTNSPAQNIWIYVYNPDGSLFQSKASDIPAGRREVIKAITQPGIYTVVIRHAYAVEATYEGSVTLAVPGSQPPVVVDGEIASGGEYSWSGGPDVSAHVTGCGAAPAYSGCQVKRIRVTVPEGGSTLSLLFNADLPDANDYDLYLYAPDGTLFEKSAHEGSHESISKLATLSGVYTVVIDPFLTAGSTYRATLKLA